MGSSNGSDDAPAVVQRNALVLAVALSVAIFLLAGITEAFIVGLVMPTVFALDWISDAVLSVALGSALYLWLNLRATRAALATRERAQLVHQTEMKLAESMQRRLLPSIPPPSPPIHWAAALTPAGRVGGDFFDFFRATPGTCLMLIADVSGKGIPAAMALTLVRATFRAVARETDRPAQIAARMAAIFHNEWRGAPYVTGVIVRVTLSSRYLTYTNAGHPHGVLLRERTPRELSIGGPPLGLLTGARYQEAEHPLAPGDVCVFVTDGVSEALDSSTLPWDTAIVESIERAHARSAEEICQTVLALAQQGRGPAGVEGWSDDRTVVVLSVIGGTSTRGSSRE